ncbi:MAG: MBL fold metallo-hydrolase [Gammaproteobacteria bacterium]|nr:MBL fold metallo-hydrolase [Gammaproteobacteria bacterium]
MRRPGYYWILVFCFFPFSPSIADNTLELHRVADNIYAIVGELGNRTPENLGNNATFGFVVTGQGVVVIDPGGTYKGAQQLHQLIKGVTSKPIVTVINTGGQDHRWLGNGYFKGLDANIIASKNAVNDQKTRQQDIISRLGNRVGDAGLEGTDAIHAEQVFDNQLRFEIGGVIFEIIHAGHAHTPGDSFVWLPQHKIMFTGDIVYTQRMLSVGSQSSSKSWINAYRTMAAYKPEKIVPGHGQPTTLERANADTYDYLVFLRNTVSRFIDDGGDIADISRVDQSGFKYLLNYKTLAGRNAQQVYSELEWE